MDWNHIEGMWKQAKGKVKEKWGQLTEVDLSIINGRRDRSRARSNNATALPLITFAKR